MSRFIHLSVIGMTLLLLSACSYNAGFNSSYLPPAGIQTKMDASILIVMTRQQEEWVFSGNPTSFTGGGTTLTLPLGNITKQVALEVFSRNFSSADMANEMPENSTYRLIVNPHIKHFDYAYNQLKNLGFAITPEVNLDLDVSLFAADGSLLLQKTYSSGLRTGDSYMASGSPGEKINKTLHNALFDLMQLAAKDTVTQLGPYNTQQ